jgi:hypothetical protein
MSATSVSQAHGCATQICIEKRALLPCRGPAHPTHRPLDRSPVSRTQRSSNVRGWRSDPPNTRILEPTPTQAMPPRGPGTMPSTCARAHNVGSRYVDPQ